MTTYRVAVIGGTGPQGRGLAWRFARHGHTVVIGSRTEQRAAEAATELRARAAAQLVGSELSITGLTNAEACAGAQVVLLAVPWDGLEELVASLGLSDQIVISCANPLGFDKAGPFGVPVREGLSSIAEVTQELAPHTRVVGAFHHVSAQSLLTDEEYLAEDVLVCGDDAEAKAVVAELARAVTDRAGVDVGALRLARQLEPFTAVLISINKRYRCRSGINVAHLGV